MALFVLSDTHLSLNTAKPMDIFGNRWNGYVEKLKERWNATIQGIDTIVLAGDISWAMSLPEALEDFRFLAQLNGTKLIGKGNHDYWWSTVKKMTDFLDKNAISSIQFLYNTAFEIEQYIVCGSRGWYIDEKFQTQAENADYTKIVAREAARLEISLQEGKRLQNKIGAEKEMLVFLHFPPCLNSYICREIIDVLHQYHIKRCYFGHIHGAYDIPQSFLFEEIEFTITSADYLSFIPFHIA